MQFPGKVLTALVVVLHGIANSSHAADTDLLPPRLVKEQREHLERFLKQHQRPDQFVPTDAKVQDAQATELDTNPKGTADKPIKQYLVQITMHRPVPDQEQVKHVDVYYYRPNPEKGKPGITVKHTVDLITGKQVGATEVFLKRHTPISREELTEAVTLARAKSPAVQALYKDREDKAVRWEYLQLMIGRKTDQHEPGDRVVRFVFRANAPQDQPTPAPVAVIVNLTKGTAGADPK
jgi:hypothetical protein